MERHFGELGFGSSGRSRSSRKGKKSNSDKPRQPQRGLGVAQLEKIRLHGQMASYPPSLHSPFHGHPNKEEDQREEVDFSPSFFSSSISTSSSSFYNLHAKHMMAFGDNERSSIKYHGFPSSSTASLFPPHDLVRETVTLPLLEGNMEEDSLQKERRGDRYHSMGSISRNLDSSEAQELDLDLKL